MAQYNGNWYPPTSGMWIVRVRVTSVPQLLLRSNMNILKSFENAFKKMKERNWDKIYVLVDIHDTIFEASYENEETFKWFPYAMEALSLMTNSKQIDLILWTSTYPSDIDRYLKEFEKYHIKFDFINRNNETENTSLSCFNEKTYFNVGIDDKFGFDAESDWEKVYEYLVECIRLDVFR